MRGRLKGAAEQRPTGAAHLQLVAGASAREIPPARISVITDGIAEAPPAVIAPGARACGAAAHAARLGVQRLRAHRSPAPRPGWKFIPAAQAAGDATQGRAPSLLGADARDRPPGLDGDSLIGGDSRPTPEGVLCRAEERSDLQVVF